MTWVAGAHMIPQMADRREMIAHLDELLDSPGFPDYGPNGLQVPGALEVERVVTGVSATLELFETAAEREAQMVLVHHGIFWGEHAPLSQQQADRLRALLTNDINLVAYHLPLDAHLDHGNNALLAEALDLPVIAPFGDYKGRKIGVLSECAPVAGSELAARIERVLGREPLHFAFAGRELSRIAIVAGSAPDYLEEAAAAGADALLTGEPAERVQANAKELGLDFFAAGHHATERFGVQRLGALLSERFGVDHTFIDIDNPV